MKIIHALIALVALFLASCAGLNVSEDGYIMTKPQNGLSSGFTTDENGKVSAYRVEFENEDGVKVRIDRKGKTETISYLDPSGAWVTWDKESGVSILLPKAEPIVTPTK